MTDGRYLRSPDRRIRRWSAVPYCAATAAATLAWAAWPASTPTPTDGGSSPPGIVVVSLPLWFVAAGIGLRLVGVGEMELARRGR